MSRSEQGDEQGSPPTGGLSAVLPKKPKVVERVMALGERVHLPLLASALTFDALLALIPLVVLTIEGLGYILAQTTYLQMADPAALLSALLPLHVHTPGAPDPFALVEGLLTTVQGYHSRFSWVAVPAFLWFGSRLFAAIRGCLSQIFEARGPQRHERPVFDFLLGMVFGKLRDFGMMGALLLLALLNTVLSTAVSVMTSDAVALTPPFTFLTSTLGRVLAELLAIGSALLLFTLLYRYASPKRLAWKGSLLAAVVATVGFEVAKRLYGLYLSYWAGGGVYAVDASIGAVLLFLLWVFWVAMIFLIGAAAAAVWDKGRIF